MTLFGSFQGASWSTAGLACCPALEKLEFGPEEEVAIPADDFPVLMKLSRLRIPGPLGGRGLKQLLACKNLEAVSIERANLTDGQVEDLASLPKLKDCYLKLDRELSDPAGAALESTLARKRPDVGWTINYRTNRRRSEE